MKKKPFNKILNLCCGPFKNNLNTTTNRRKFKIICNVKKIGKKPRNQMKRETFLPFNLLIFGIFRVFIIFSKIACGYYCKFSFVAFIKPITAEAFWLQSAPGSISLPLWESIKILKK
jgi:hypothetical protein